MVDPLKMMIKLTFILALATAGFAGADETLPREQAWRESLGSPDFQKRYEASVDIWKTGDGALPVLENFVTGDDPELAARAGELALKIRSGITPDTSAEVVTQIDLFFATNANSMKKVAVLEELRRLEHYDFIIRLRSLETDEAVMERADEIIEAVLPDLIRRKVSEGKIDEVRFLLTFCNDFPSMIAYANLAAEQGDLDAEIARLRELDGPHDRARYLACLRVKGDAGLLQFEAQRLGDREAEALASLALGQYVPFFEYLVENADLGRADRHYLDWTLAEARGDLKKKEELKEELLDLTKEKSEFQYARRNLFRMGYRDEVVAGFRSSELAYVYDYLIGQEAYREILPAMGLPDGELTEEWLTETRRNFKAELRVGRSSDASDLLFYVGGFFEGRGEVDKATKCFEALFEVIRKQKTMKISEWFSSAFGMAPRAALRLIAKETGNPDFDLAATIEEIFGSNSQFPWLYAQLEELRPTETVEARLLLAASFNNHMTRGFGSRLFVPEKDFEKAQEDILESVLKSENKTFGIRKLLMCAQSRQWRDDVEKFVTLLEEENVEQSDLNKGYYAARRMRYDEAGEHFSNVQIDERQSSVTLIYEKGTAMLRGEIPGGEDNRRKARLYSLGSSADLLNFVRVEFRYGREEEVYDLAQKALLRLNLSGEGLRQRGPANSIFSLLAEGAMARKEWQKAIAFSHGLAWETTSGSSISTTRARFQILLARGAEAKWRGDLVGAVDLFTEAHSLLPRDGFLANDFFPLVRDLGLVELHDQLFAKSARYAREIIAHYPKDDNALNNFAWMASRANRRLDEAEEYLKKALEMTPRSAAYLDTMGEIFFARRNRLEALRWSEMSLGYEMSDVKLQSQNRRFRNGDFPAP